MKKLIEKEIYEELDFGIITINISGKEIEVSLTRDKGGDVVITPTDGEIYSRGGWLEHGSTMESYGGHVVTISRYEP